jgi:hypothetical protein
MFLFIFWERENVFETPEHLGVFEHIGVIVFGKSAKM